MTQPQCAEHPGTRSGTRINASTVVVCAPQTSRPEHLLAEVESSFPATSGFVWRLYCVLPCPKFDNHHKHHVFTLYVAQSVVVANPALSAPHRVCAANINLPHAHIHGSQTRATVCVPSNTLDARAARHVETISPAGAGQAWKFADVCGCPTYPDHHIHYSFVKEPTQEGGAVGSQRCATRAHHSRFDKRVGRMVVACTPLSEQNVVATVEQKFPEISKTHDWKVAQTEQCGTHASHKHFVVVANPKSSGVPFVENYDAPPPSVWDEEALPEMEPMQDPLQPMPDMVKDLDRADPLPVSVVRLTTTVQQKAAELAEAMTHSQRVDAAVQIATAAQILLYNTIRDMQGVLAPDTLHLADPAMDPATQMRAVVTGEKWLATLTPEQVRASSAWTRKLFELVEEKMEKKRAQWKKTEKITVIKYVRVITGWGLKESKEFVDRHIPGSLV